MKKILILGAGVYQVPLITTAKRLGIQTIVVTSRGNIPGEDNEKMVEIMKKRLKIIKIPDFSRDVIIKKYCKIIKNYEMN